MRGCPRSARADRAAERPVRGEDTAQVPLRRTDGDPIVNQDVWSGRSAAEADNPSPGAAPSVAAAGTTVNGRRALGDGPSEELIDALLAVMRRRLLAADADEPLIRRPVPCTVADRKKVRIREVHTDRPVAELVAEAVLALLAAAPESVVAGDERAAKKRTDKITVAAPQWWWELAALAAAAAAGSTADVVAAAISSHLPN